MALVYCEMATPLGTLTLQATQQGLTGAWFEVQTTKPAFLGNEDNQHPLLQEAKAQLSAYFNGDRTSFSLPLAASGTEFQQQVWQGLRQIDYGSTWSYQQLATYIGKPKAVRAVGAANGKNPLSIIVPCHRVIGKNNSLTGYAGGVQRKEWLLAHEQRISSTKRIVKM